MSLRRSARVQAFAPPPQVLKETSLKRVFATTKASSVKPTIKVVQKTNITVHSAADDSAKENGVVSKPTSKAATSKKRRKVEVKESAVDIVTAVPTDSLASDDTGNIVGGFPLNRPAGPHITNAPVESPKDGHVVTAYSTFEDGPLPATIPPPSAMTSTLLDKALAHLIAVDTTGKLKSVIKNHHCQVFSPAGLAEAIDPFRSLSSGIISQQVSGAAASSIKKKFISLFSSSPEFPSPRDVAATPIPTLRTAGLSQRKAEYIQGLADKFSSGELSAEMLAVASDDEVMERLVAVRGLGKWSVQMFACFDLKRMDVFSTGDLGVQRGMAAYMGKDVSKLKAKGGGKWKYMSEQDMLDISAKFAPYRSLFMWYMWRFADVNVEAIQDT